MTEHQKRIREFNRLAGRPTPTQPITPTAEARRLRVKLIAEELVELCAACDVNLKISGGEVFVTGGIGVYDEVEAYDAFLDLDYVVVGAADEFGQDMEPGQIHLHASNLTKFIDGHRREDGKWVKGPSYSPVDLAPILDAMREKP